MPTYENNDLPLALATSFMLEKQAENEILACNEFTREYGLSLNSSQVMRLIETQSSALKNTGRIEFGNGVVHKLIVNFCNSPYMSRENYEDVLHELTELFYILKNETGDRFGDDFIICRMKEAFNGECRGATELLYEYLLSDLKYRT